MSETVVRRQLVNYLFYKLDPATIFAAVSGKNGFNNPARLSRITTAFTIAFWSLVAQGFFSLT